MAAARRMVVIGGDAAGMSAASRARRLRSRSELEILAFERGQFTSYSACGIPYWVGGVVDGPDELVARTPETHQGRGIDVRTHTEVVEIDPAGQRVLARDVDPHGKGDEHWHGFDDLVIATGARPRRPDMPGIDAPGVHGVQTLEHGRALLETLESTRVERAVVIGASTTSGWRWPRRSSSAAARSPSWSAVSSPCPRSTRTWGGWCATRCRGSASTP